MLNPQIWIEGGTTMAVGMGIVFSFLVILIFAILIMTKVVGFLNKICPVATTGANVPAKKATNNNIILLLNYKNVGIVLFSFVNY